jgi:hypothetical protein
MASSRRGVLRRLLMSDGLGKGVRDTCVTTYQVYLDPNCHMNGLLKCRVRHPSQGAVLLELARLCLDPPPLVSFDQAKAQVLHNSYTPSPSTASCPTPSCDVRSASPLPCHAKISDGMVIEGPELNQVCPLKDCPLLLSRW